MTQPEIDIYYASVCGLCHKAIDFLKYRGLSFEAKAIGYDKEKDDWVPGPMVDEMKRIHHDN